MGLFEYIAVIVLGVIIISVTSIGVRCYDTYTGVSNATNSNYVWLYINLFVGIAAVLVGLGLIVKTAMFPG